MPRTARLNPLVRSGPDIDGWRDAHERLIDALGVSIEFRVPTPRVWASNVPVDPETGEPYDPTAVPVSGGEMTPVLITSGPVFRAIKPEDPIFQTVAGVRRGEDVAVIVKEVDEPRIRDATEFTLFNIDYRVTEIIEDGLVSRDRFIAYGEAL